MQNMYKISKQNDDYVVANKYGVIIAYFGNRADADAYKQDQIRADEQSQVMAAFNMRHVEREMRADFIAEFSN
jgi:hypothetical protein